MKLQNQRSFGARDVFKMSVPIFIELLLQMLVGNVDQFMVSRISQTVSYTHLPPGLGADGCEGAGGR